MPRASSSSVSADASAEMVPPKTPRKRAPRKRAPVSSEESEKATTNTVPERVEAPNTTPTTRTVARKAPARISEDTPAAARTRSSLPYVMMTIIFVCGIGLSALIGLTDKGTIDINARIQASNADAVGRGDTDGNGRQVLPVQNTAPTVPNGGLRGRGIDSGVAVPPPTEVSSTTATSSTATSTEPTPTPTTTEADAGAATSDPITQPAETSPASDTTPTS